MVLLLALPALAVDYTCASGDSLTTTVGFAHRGGVTATILVASGCEVDADHLEFSPLIGSASEFTLRPEAETGTVEVPPIVVAGGHTLHLERVEITRASGELGVGPVVTDTFDLGPGAAIYVEESTLDVNDVTLTPDGGGGGLVLVDGTVEGTGLSASGFEVRPVIVVADTARTTFAVTDLVLSENIHGAMALFGAGEDVEALLTTPTFTLNGPAAAADLGAVNVADLRVERGTFSGSEAVTESEVSGAPVYIQGGSFSCEECTFRDTTGDTASLIAAYLDTGDTLSLVSGTYEPASMTGTSLHVDTGGRFVTSTVRFLGAGDVYRYGGTTEMYGTHFEGAGGAPDRHALKLFGTTAMLDGLTVCGYAASGWALIGAYASAVTLTDSVIESNALDGGVVLEAREEYGDVELTVRDNTMVASDAVLVGGSPATLSFVNNLVATSTGGLALDVSPVGEVGYNLWYEVDEPVAGGSPEATDVVDRDPRFVTTYDPTVCGDGPFLRAGSPADGAGTPAETDIYGNRPSDIGAIDHDERSDTGTVPDDTATDPGETGSVDTAETDAGGGEPEGEALVGGALPPCACGVTTGGGPLLALGGLLALVRGRRRP